MRAASSVLLGVVFVGLAAPGGAQTHTYWVPAVAHNAGLAGTVWRSDVAVLNLCPAGATVELLLHTAGGVSSASYEVQAGRQQVFPDVVAQLVTGDATGALEIRCNQELVVTSRTYNLAAGGTYGQSLDGITKSLGIDLGESAYLAQLQQSATFRTNIGAVNMGEELTTLTVELYDQAGASVGSFELQVPAGELRQDNAPFSARFGRTDVVAGFARVTVDGGGDTWLYASVVDNQTGDPTTAAMRTFDGECDLSQALDRFFSLERVHDIAIEIDDDGVQSLLDSPREYVHASVTIDSVRVDDVGVRLKGGAGSFVPLDGTYPPISGDGNCRPGKSPFIIDFNRYQGGLSWLGLGKLTLNNMVQDDSVLHEFLGYSLFRAQGVPASRTAYARVTFNGEEKGLYLAVEGPDNDEFLRRWFGTADASLYEGEYGADLFRDHVPRFDQDRGSDPSRQDLYALVDALDAIGPGDDPLPTLEQVFDFDAYLAFAAAEVYLGHWDGYVWSANNYFILHHFDLESWVFVPWGVDQVFEDPMGPFAGVMRHPGPSWGIGGGRVHGLCYSSSACRSRVYQALEEVVASADDIHLSDLADEARQLVEPHILAESTEYGDPLVTLAAFDQVSSYIAGRRQAVEAWLPCLVGSTVDTDGDLYDGCTVDCDDMVPDVHPGAAEPCNLRDDDCNGIIDDPAHCPRCLAENAPDGSPYSLCFDRVPWPAARDRCVATGAELASVHDRQTFEHLSRALLERVRVEHAWIGLNDRQVEGTFEWTDGSPVDFVAWTTNSPKPLGEAEDCVVSSPWGWSDVLCDLEHAFICARPE